jgi:methionine sulfoxide reductase heme-binding subunit
VSALAGIADVPFWWMVARVSGIVGYLLIVGSMVSGVVLHTRLVQKLASPVARMEWHKILAVLGLALVALHGVALVMDSYVTISWSDLLVPGGTDYRPLWVSFGVLAMWLMVIVSLTATWRKHLGAKAWKAIHLASYGVFVAVTVHGLMAGTDSNQPWMLGIYVVSTALVAGVAARRIIAGPNAPLKRRRAGTAQASAPPAAEAAD